MSPSLNEPPADPFAHVVFHDGLALGIEGRGFPVEALGHPYDRLPAAAEGVVPEPVWSLSRQPAGLSVRFFTDADAIYARWELEGETDPGDNNTRVRVGGLDCYGRAEDGRWCWVGKCNPWKFPVPDGRFNQVPLDGAWREYRVYLPHGQVVRSLEIGVHRDAAFSPAEPDKRRPIVIYGTSIVHGGCVSRPGMCHAAILERMFDYPVVNLGFSGNGRMEAEVVRFLAEIDAGLLVVDCLPNMSPEQIAQRVGPLARDYRKARPAVPIVFLCDRLFGDAAFCPARRQTQADKSDAQRIEFEKLRAEGTPDIHLLGPANYFGDDFDGTVDGSHPSDLGAWRMAQAVAPTLWRVLCRGR